MGKYHGSPWGIISGKLGDFVGGKWKGVLWNRILVFPTQRGTLDLYHDYKDGIIPPERFSFPQMNIRRAITQFLGFIARANITNWIYPVWEEFVDKRGWLMTGSNAFVKRNANRLFASMDRTLEYDPDTNAPDLVEMLVSDGDLEPTTEVLTAVYTTGTGELIVTWDTDVYTNGDDTDMVHLMVAKKPILESVGREGTWYPSLWMYGPFGGDPVMINRDAGTITMPLPAGLDAADLTAYIFFRDKEATIGNSPSASLQITAPV